MTKKESKDKRINDILDAAVNEFIEKGYEAASMDSIAARAGLTKGGLYYHFDGKDDILISANERFMVPVIEIMGEASASARASRGLEAYITRYISYWTAHPREMSFIFLTMAKSITEERFARLFAGYTERVVGFIEELYRKGIAAGEFREMNARSAAVALMAALDGIIGYIFLDDTLGREETTGDLIDAFITIHKKDKSDAQ